MQEKAILSVNGQEIELPIVQGTENEIAVDISKLRAQTGVVTIDRGYKNTGATFSGITFLDGEKGILRYRGYSIEDLTNKGDFLEVVYLLLFGELPNEEQYSKFFKDIKDQEIVHERLKKISDEFPSGAHPMGVLSSLVSALTAFHPNTLKPHASEEEAYLYMVKLIAKLPTIAAWTYRKHIGRPANYPCRSLDYTSNFLYMLNKMPNNEYTPNPIASKALNQLLILHADHEQNCSTSTVRMVGSSNASLYASISAGINALWGPLHGGANQAVIEMLESIKEDGGDVDKFIAKAKDKNDPFRLMGFGHRVYKNFDPRAKLIKQSADDVLSQLGIKDPVLDIAKKLEETALSDPYFIDRKLFPNVDFYSGIIYRALGIPTEMFTVMFAIGRLPGWIAQWKEMRETVEPIGRPRQIYTGEVARDFVEIKERDLVAQ
ncbi:MAG: citrate synthase [Ichthyobacteriaceae bacterium]|nr:citrate synthase [Ichthyobacteriaceae bacterium]